MVKKSLISHYSPLTLTDAITKAIEELGWNIVEQSPQKIQITTPPSFLSWGETIEISIKGESNGTHISIISEPNIQLFDWGKSEDNINLLLNVLSSVLDE
jgi:hypothetical protein